MHSYVALLRGINVGGNNLIKMAELKVCFEKNGYKNVRTYIQSGNVLFESSEKSATKLTNDIETMLGKAFKYEPVVVVKSQAQMKHIVTKAPKGFGTDPAAYRYDVFFIKDPATPKQVMDTVQPKEGVDEITAGEGVMYFSRLNAKVTSSRISKVVGTPVYKNVTIRNWNTTIKLLKLMEEG
jgi:uncharacterized protein (DUF1697 family)